MRRLLLLLILVGSTCWGHPIGERGMVHEALVPAVTSEGVLGARLNPPPLQINEVAPPQPGRDLVWIGGYWAWAEDIDDWVWVSGVWRKPPPGRGWIRGFWRELEQGWVRVPGFWSSQPVEEFELIEATPPDPVEEEVPPPPGADFFWIPGYWHYQGDYVWLGGGWTRLDVHWMLQPANYSWRPGGYIFVESYWDWPLEERGVAYENAPRDVGSEPFKPSVNLDDEEVLERLFCCYPNHLAFFQHHHYFHPDFWNRWCCTPPWWSWNSWWSFTWTNSWALWWWWSHPGYPQPSWISEDLSSQILPPNQETVLWMKRTKPPATVTGRGVARPKQLRDALELLTHRDAPILPARPRRILDRVERSLAKPGHVLRPTGVGEVRLQRPMMVPGTLSEPPEGRPSAPLPKKPALGKEMQRRQRVRTPQNFESLPGQRRPGMPGSRQRPWLRRKR